VVSRFGGRQKFIDGRRFLTVTWNW